MANQKFLPLLLSVTSLSMALSVPAARATDLGINYDVIATDAAATANCKTDPNAAVHQKFVVARYTNQPMQKAVRDELPALHQSGFQSVRSIVQLFPGAHPSGDLVNAQKVDDAVTASIANYVRDVRDAGFRELILAFATQGVASPACRKSEWGDCFDPATIPVSVDAEAKIIRAAQSVKGISLRLDLLNEACVSSVVPKKVNDNFSQFIRAAAKMHAANFSSIPATVSCQLERTGDGLVTTQRLFTESGDHIGFFDIHAYPQPTRREPQILQQAADSLKGEKTPILFGETTYGDPDYRHWIVDAFRSGFHRDPQEVIFWPLHSMASHCNFDVPHPYTLKDAVGKE